MTFTELKLLPEILKAVQELGYVEPSPIQAKAIPPALAGQDLIGCAQTGTGKTAAFAIPILQNLARTTAKGARPIRALVLTPTRELALQNKQSFDDYGCYLKVRNTVVFGGVGQGPQVAALQRGVDILVATPGRLNDLCNQGYIDLSRVEYFVLDEADRMLDMGFIHDVRKVLDRLPQQRQTMLFSATMPREIAELAKKILHDPVRVAVTPVASTVDAIVQSVYKVDKVNKRFLLDRILADHPEYDSILVFTRTKHGADRVVKDLTRTGTLAMAIHGNKSQTARQTALEKFKSGEIRVLVATDIAARGIDINGLACVVNYELPNIPETYVHRIGRTGRAGRDGVAISFCNFDELPYLADIEKLIGKQVPVVEEHPWPMQIFTATPKPERQPRPPREQRDGASPRRKSPQRGETQPQAHAPEKAPKPQNGQNGRTGQPQSGGRHPSGKGGRNLMPGQGRPKQNQSRTEVHQAPRTATKKEEAGQTLGEDGRYHLSAYWMDPPKNQRSGRRPPHGNRRYNRQG
jgi:ATP-dependent RNA helicase RhlE